MASLSIGDIGHAAKVLLLIARSISVAKFGKGSSAQEHQVWRTRCSLLCNVSIRF